MKKEIMNIINNGGTVKLNDAVSLVREIGEWKYTDTISEKVDVLHAEIKVIGIKGRYTANIKSRNYDSIIAELNYAIKTAYAEAAENLCKEFKVGHH